MKFNYRKIAAVASSALMVGMTAGVAAAANYPAPFVVGSSADVAIVYGTGTDVSSLDLIQAGNIQTDLASSLEPSDDGETTFDGESFALFTSSSKIYMNKSMNNVRTTLTDTELPTVLADGSFEGDSTRDYTQLIKIGSTPILEFGNHPTSDDDPIVAFSTGTSTSSVMYNMTITFDGAVNFTDSDSIGESLTLFGREYTVGAGTTTSKLYLYESSETVGLSVGGTDPTSQTVTVNGETYTIQLVSASDSAATISVTDSSGGTQTKEISEDSSKKVQGIDIAVDLADEDTATSRLIAEVTVGANKILLQNGNKVKVGSDEDSIDGTLVTGSYTTDWTDATGFTIGVVPDDTDVDALVAGEAFTDPVFGTIKVDFTSLESDSDREDIIVDAAGGDKATLEMTTHRGDTKSINWFYNDSVTARLADSGDSGKDVIHVMEGEKINVTQYVVVGNEDEGYLLELYQFSNDTDDTDDDIIFRDAFNTENEYTVTGITSEGSGELIVGGKTYTVSYHDESAEGADYVTLDYPDTSTAGDRVIYPTVQTSKGAKVAFYEPKTGLSLSDPVGDGTGLSGKYLYLPDGDGYSSIKLVHSGSDDGNWTITYSSTAGSTGSNCTYVSIGDNFDTTNSSNTATCTIGQLKYRFSGNGTANYTDLYLLDAAETSTQTLPGLVIFQEENKNNVYEALIVEMDGKTTSSELAGVTEVETTWNNNAGISPDWNEKQMEATDSDMYATYTKWGTLITTDKSDSDQYSATISYPDEQINAEVYVAEADASSSSGGTGSLGEVLVKDSEVSSVSTKNLIVVGGSCINSAAATLLGGAYCTTDFTTNTGVGSGEFLIKSFGDSTLTSTGKIALLVAGYDAADTVNAATYLTTQTVDTTAGKEYKGTSGTTATEVA